MCVSVDGVSAHPIFFCNPRSTSPVHKCEFNFFSPWVGANCAVVLMPPLIDRLLFGTLIVASNRSRQIILHGLFDSRMSTWASCPHLTMPRLAFQAFRIEQLRHSFHNPFLLIPTA